MIVTSFSDDGYEKYGRAMVSSMEQFLPVTRGVVYTEGGLFTGTKNFIAADLCTVPAFDSFLRRHDGSQHLSGRVPGPGWKAADVEKGYCFRFDALKFCRKVFAIADAARVIGRGPLTWIDADVLALATPPPDFFNQLCQGADVAYLGRDRTHSECGFMHFKLPGAMPLIQALENFYASDRFLQEREYHDSYLFDVARGEVPSVPCRNIAPPGRRGHIWVESPLNQWFDHRKGERKEMGYSPERYHRGGI